MVRQALSLFAADELQLLALLDVTPAELDVYQAMPDAMPYQRRLQLYVALSLAASPVAKTLAPQLLEATQRDLRESGARFDHTLNGLRISEARVRMRGFVGRLGETPQSPEHAKAADWLIEAVLAAKLAAGELRPD